VYSYKVLGGFGNQIFQIIEAITVSRRLGHQIYLDFSEVGTRDSHEVFWRAHLCEINEIRFIDKSKHFVDVSQSMHISEFNDFTKDTGNIHIQFFGWNPNIKEYEKSGLIRRGTFLFDGNKLIPYEKFRSAIHLRRGDYLESPNLGTTSNHYYLKSLKLLQKRGITHIRVFSDDIEFAEAWAKSYLIRDFEIDVDSELEPISALKEMSRFQFIVTSNSTFSFWAHYFSGGTAIFPFPFYNHEPWFYRNFYRSDTKSVMTLDLPRIHSASKFYLRKSIFKLMNKISK
jgi:hypothetical protein